MTTTTNPRFDGNTQALEVAQAFAGQITGKTILVTGVNPKGIGFATVEAFASQSPSLIIIAGRNPAKLHESITALAPTYPHIPIRPLQLDLSSQAAIRTAATELLSWTDVPAINILINSAGIMTVPKRILSEDGIELTLATNHIGHFLFANLIMPKLLSSAASRPPGATRIVNVSSLSPCWAKMRWSDVNFDTINSELPADDQPNFELHRAWGAEEPEKKSYLPLEGYNQSKVANVLFSIAANRRLYEKHGILSLTVHPGVVATELGRNAMPDQVEAVAAMKLTYKTLGGGAATSLTAALDPKLGPGEKRNGKENWGVYLIDCQISDKARAEAESSSEAEKLWKLSEDLVKEEFSW